MTNKILAQIDDKVITESEIDSALKQLPQEQAMYFNTPDGRAQLLEQLVNFEVFLKYAKENNIEEEEEFKTQLKRVKEEILVQYMYSKIMREATVEEKELEDYYNVNKDTFTEGESVRAKHILVATEDEALKVKKEIEEGLSFEEAAQKYSTCPSNVSGGDLGFFHAGQMVPEFEKAAFEAEIGDVTEPVQTQFGFHLVKVEEKKPAVVKSFEEVKDVIRKNILTDRQRYKVASKADELRKAYNVTINQ
ncbi:peptidil-prolyl cis-trans isomerase [Clostridium bornimense]|uniref:Peptidil-prolyl cis-trans isomerase n=1 Tax=Clostridium bornimense TaxID=1216932 RepID=W6RRZ3_9CLOT|nr:peptidyl-prolyl cis-trans isomerase [Clostridium bornimense]CDM67356.1 peptidil-prolyl cis-trans isomerase [Clostridium bornimense]